MATDLEPDQDLEQQDSYAYSEREDEDDFVERGGGEEDEEGVLGGSQAGVDDVALGGTGDRYERMLPDVKPFSVSKDVYAGKRGSLVPEGEEESSSGTPSPVIEEYQDYNAKLTEKVLSQAMHIKSLEEEVEDLRAKLVSKQRKGEDAVSASKTGASTSSGHARLMKEKKVAEQTVAKLSERAEKAEKRASEYQKRATTAGNALKSKDRELRKLRTTAERLGKENEKIEKTNKLLQTYVGRLECRLNAAVNTKDDREMVEVLGQKLTRAKGEKEELQNKLSEAIQENIVLSESLNEVRNLFDNEAVSLGLDSGEVLVELTAQKQACSLLEQKVESQEKDNQLLVDYIKDLRVTSQLSGASAVAAKLSNPDVVRSDHSQSADELILQQRLESVREEIHMLGVTVKAQEEREKLLIQSSQEEKKQLHETMKELSEVQAMLDSLALSESQTRKKYNHLKTVFKSLNTFCVEASQMEDFNEIDSLDLSKLDEVERQVVNISTNILGPENRTFIKLYMSILSAALEQRRININSEEEIAILRESLKDYSAKVTSLVRQKALVDKELSKQQVVSSIQSHTNSISVDSFAKNLYSTPSFGFGSVGERPKEETFAFQTKSFADSIQQEAEAPSVKSDQKTSRKLGELERELEIVKSIAKRSESSSARKSAEEAPEPIQQSSPEVVGSTSKFEYKKEDNSSDTEFMSPLSTNSGYDSAKSTPFVDFGKHNSTRFTPGKYTIKERMQLLQNRFNRLNQEKT